MSGEVRCWYLNQKGKATGPFAFSDLKSMAAQGTLKGHDLVFREGSAEWKRAYDWPELVQECFSDENRSSLSRLIKLPEEERAVEDQWVLLVREDGEKEVRFRQKGPFQTDEIRRMLVEEKIKPSDHIWKKGAARWVPLYDVPEFRVHNLKMTKAAEAALSQVASMPDLAQAHADPFAAMMPATPDQAGAAGPASAGAPAASVAPVAADSVEPVQPAAEVAKPVEAAKPMEAAKPAATESAGPATSVGSPRKVSAVRASIPAAVPGADGAAEAKNSEAQALRDVKPAAETKPAAIEAKPATAVDAEPVEAAKPAATDVKSAPKPAPAEAKPAIPAAADAKPAPAAAKPTNAADTPDRQAIREWALGLVEKAQKNDPDVVVPGKAQVFSPEVTKTDHEIAVSNPVANPAPAPQSPSPQSLTPKPAAVTSEPMPLLAVEPTPAEPEDPRFALDDDEPEDFVVQPLKTKSEPALSAAPPEDGASAAAASPQTESKPVARESAAEAPSEGAPAAAGGDASVVSAESATPSASEASPVAPVSATSVAASARAEAAAMSAPQPERVAAPAPAAASPAAAQPAATASTGSSPATLPSAIPAVGGSSAALPSAAPSPEVPSADPAAASRSAALPSAGAQPVASSTVSPSAASQAAGTSSAAGPSDEDQWAARMAAENQTSTFSASNLSAVTPPPATSSVPAQPNASPANPAAPSAANAAPVSSTATPPSASPSAVSSAPAAQSAVNVPTAAPSSANPSSAAAPSAVPPAVEPALSAEGVSASSSGGEPAPDGAGDSLDVVVKVENAPAVPPQSAAAVAVKPAVAAVPGKAPGTPDFSDELTPVPTMPVSGVERVPMPIFSTGAVVPDDGSAEEIINPARLSENYSFETKSAQKAADAKGKIPSSAAPVPSAQPGAPQPAAPQPGSPQAPAAPAAKAATPAKTPAGVKVPAAAAAAPAGASAGKTSVRPAEVRPAETQPAAGASAAPQPAAPPADYVYDFEPPKTFFSKAAPFFGVMVIAIFGAGVWATLNTDKSVFQSSSTASQIPIVAPPNELPALEPVEVPPPAAKAAPKPVAAQTPPAAAADDGPDVITVDAPAPQPAAPAQAAAPAATPAPAPAPAAAAAANPAADFDGKNPIVRINAQNSFLEIMGPFRKGELLRIRIEGRAGQILDLPALVQKYEVRAGQDHYYRVSIKEARIPKGEYLVAVQFGMNRFSRGVGYGKDAGFREALQGHRKSISYDQQQERKRLLAATKDFAQLLAKAETAAKDANAIKTLQRELDKKTPRELRLVRTNRYELVFFDYWEKLAAQWERVQVTMKDNPGRNPASVGEYSRARKMATSLENEVRASSIWN